MPAGVSAAGRSDSRPTTAWGRASPAESSIAAPRFGASTRADIFADYAARRVWSLAHDRSVGRHGHCLQPDRAHRRTGGRRGTRQRERVRRRRRRRALPRGSYARCHLQGDDPRGDAARHHLAADEFQGTRRPSCRLLRDREWNAGAFVSVAGIDERRRLVDQFVGRRRVHRRDNKRVNRSPAFDGLERRTVQVRRHQRRGIRGEQ